MMLDVEKIVKDWINSRNDLVGDGKPIKRGAFLKRLSSEGTYVQIMAIGTPVSLTAESPTARSRISGTVYGGTKQAACNAAVAYVTVLEKLQGQVEHAGDYKVLVVDNISGPLPLDDHLTTREQFRYQVDADFYVSA